MNKLNISSLPLYVRYEKRCNRFYISLPNKTNKYFSKNNPTKS